MLGFIPFAHYMGGNPVEEDKCWMQWVHEYIGKPRLLH